MSSLVELGLTDKEPQTVDPSSDDRVPDVSNAVVLEDQVVSTYDGRVDEVEPEGVTSVLVQDLFGVGVIPQTLAHLLSIASEYQTRDDQIFPGSRVEQVSTEDNEGVEPSSGLIDTLGDKVGGESSLELFVRGAERVVLLRVGHAARRVRLVSAPIVAMLNHIAPTYLPDSNQQSNTSSTRFRSPLPCLEGMVMWSMFSL